MRARRKKFKRRINIKRFSISLIIFVVLLTLTTKFSMKIMAKNSKDEKDLIDIEEKDPLEEISEKETSLQEIEKDDEKQEKLEENIEENINIDKIQEPKEEEIKKEEIKEQKPKQENKKTSKNPSEYNEYFKNDLFIGDSITDSLAFYELIDQNNVIAKLGLTTLKAQDEIETISNQNPENIYLMFGMNDILTFRDTEKFIKHYKELIDIVRKKFPEAKIYIQSILPVSSKVKDKKPALTNENINKFNQCLIDMAEQENIAYLNTNSIVEGDMNLLEPDGIHVKYKFYELWLDYLIDNTKK